MSVFLATPCYGGNLSVETFGSFVGIAQLCGQMGIELDICAVRGESAITRGRSNLAATFLKTDRKTLAFIDADIQIAPEDFVRLLRLDKPIRGAAVCLKTADASECLNVYAQGKRVSRADMPAEQFECDYIGGAVMFIEREVVERLSDDVSLQYLDPINGQGAHIFGEMIVDGALLSEDYSLCYRARRAGFSVWCEPSIRVIHFGTFGWRA